MQSDEIFTFKRFVRQQIFPVFVFDVELFDGFHRENISGCGDRNDVRVLSEGLEKHWAVELALSILVQVQFDEVFDVDWLRNEN